MTAPAPTSVDLPNLPPTRRVHEGSGKLLGLELLRFLAAFGVLVWHYQHFAAASNAAGSFVRAEQPFFYFLRPFFEYGAYGVDLFWCISGFIFFERYGSLIPSRAVDARQFFLLRFSRLYPLHVVTLLLVAALQFIFFRKYGTFFVYEFNDVYHFILQLLLASNWGIQRGDSFNGPIWSISIEVLVYILFFLTSFFLGTRLRICGAVTVLAVGWRYLHPTSALATCIALFYAGGVAAACAAMPSDRHIKRVFSTGIALGLCVAPVVALWSGVFLKFGFLLFYLPMLVLACSGNLRTTPWVRRAVEAAGNMTYSSYLLHFPLQLVMVLTFAFMGSPLPIGSHWFFMLYVGTTLLVSSVAYRHFELPAQQWIRSRTLSTR